MATPLITSANYALLTGQTFTGAAENALAGICAAVSDALAKYLRPYSATPVTLTNYVMDAVPSNILVAPVLPIRSITSLKLHMGANGDTTLFTSDDALTAATDYFLPVDPIEGYSRDGKIYRRGSSLWGIEWRYANVRSLAPTVNPNRGAILISGTFGEASIPDTIVEAAKLMVSLLYARRKMGMPLNSESWNGYSYSGASQFTAVSALASPDVQDLLKVYRAPVHVAED